MAYSNSKKQVEVKKRTSREVLNKISKTIIK